MAEDATTAKGDTDQPLIIVDGSSNTVVLEEDPGADAPSPSAPPAAADSPGLVVVVAERDAETGEITLVEGKSTEGDGRVQISGTDRVFEDQAAFEEFLAEVNGKADAGVPFEDIIGTDVNAIPVVENGVPTGETLGGIEDGAAPDGVVQVQPPAANGNAGAPPNADGADAGASPPPGFSSGPEESGRREGDRDPDSPIGQPSPTPSANGNAANNVFPGRNQDGFERLRGDEDDSQPPAGPPVGDRQPGRDENGNLLPGADGQVTLDDFNRINDLDGNGINDGVENPVDLGGETDGEAPRFEPPLVPPVDSELPPLEVPAAEQPADPGGDQAPEAPARQPEQPVASEDPVLPGDGVGVIREPAATVNAEPANPATDVAPHPPVAAPVAPAGEAYPADAVREVADTELAAPPHAGPPPAPVVEAYPAAAVAGAAAALDTFDTETVPSALPTASSTEHVGATIANQPTPAAGAPTQPEAELPAPEDYPAHEDVDAGAAVAAGGAAAASVGATLAATDVFEPAAAAVGAATGKSDEGGGGNLLEKIFEKVKDVLFDSGGSEPSPVQLPVQADVSTPELPFAVSQAVIDPVVAEELENSPLPEDTDDAL